MDLLNTQDTNDKAVLFGIFKNSRDYLNDCTQDSMEELALLAQTAGAEVVGSMIQNRQSPESATYLGEGKVEELRFLCHDQGANLVICDDELSGVQVRNLESALDVRVIDRSALILDIFAQRAKTKEGQLQVELAQLQYFLPRLTGSFTDLSRQAGGGGIGGARRGPGETKLETDRRHIRNRIQFITKQLAEVEKHRNVQRKSRIKKGIQQIAIVGYTNAGKSTLLNYLTNAGVLAQDKLFATLDPTAKKLTLPDGTNTIIIDTVGFIRKLPHHLIKAFKSTLEESTNADVILHVADASSPHVSDNIKVAEGLLFELGASDKPRITVYNKIDLADESFIPQASENSVEISAKTGYGIDNLLQKICSIMPEKRYNIKVLIPYLQGSLVSIIHKEAFVKTEEHTDKGTLMEIVADSKLMAIVSDYIV
jgi:GTP-binding protein HflX